jgi:hypothetical protein
MHAPQRLCCGLVHAFPSSLWSFIAPKMLATSRSCGVLNVLLVSKLTLGFLLIKNEFGKPACMYVCMADRFLVGLCQLHQPYCCNNRIVSIVSHLAVLLSNDQLMWIFVTSLCVCWSGVLSGCPVVQTPPNRQSHRTPPTFSSASPPVDMPKPASRPHVTSATAVDVAPVSGNELNSIIGGF